MKHIFSAETLTEASLICGLLNARGIETHITGEYLSGVSGNQSGMNYANIHVIENNATSALSLIAEHQRINDTSQTVSSTRPALYLYTSIVSLAMWTVIALIIHTLTN